MAFLCLSTQQGWEFSHYFRCNFRDRSQATLAQPYSCNLKIGFPPLGLHYDSLRVPKCLQPCGFRAMLEPGTKQHDPIIKQLLTSVRPYEHTFSANRLWYWSPPTANTIMLIEFNKNRHLTQTNHLQINFIYVSLVGLTDLNWLVRKSIWVALYISPIPG